MKVKKTIFMMCTVLCVFLLIGTLWAAEKKVTVKIWDRAEGDRLGRV